MSGTNTGGERILYAEFTARPGQQEHVAQLVTALAGKVRAESGNRAFDVYREAEHPARFFIYEVYADESAFQSHLASDYGKAFNAELAPLIVEDGSQLTRLTRL